MFISNLHLLLSLFTVTIITTVAAQKQICVANRQLCLSSVVNGTNVDFSVTFSTLGWVSFGLSPSGTMENADTVMLWTQDVPGRGTAVQVSDRWSTGHGPPRPDPRQDWNVINAGRSNGDNRFSVTIRRLIDTREDVDLPFKTENQRYIWAMTSSPVSIDGGRPQFPIHSERGTFDYNAMETTAENASPNGPQTVDVGPGVSQATAVMIHGICMALAWGLFSYIAVFVARFMKTRLKTLWFPIHWALMLLVAGLNIIAIIFMYMYAGGRWFSTPHAVVGSIVFFAMWAQIILGVVIDRMYDPERTKVPGRDMAHRVIGYILAVGGPLAILFGLLLVQANTAILGAYIASWIMFVGLFAFGSYQMPKENKSKDPTPSNSPIVIPMVGDVSTSTPTPTASY